MAIVSLESQGTIYIDFLPHGKTIRVYNELLKREHASVDALKLRQGVLGQHSNVPVHITQITVDAVKEFWVQYVIMKFVMLINLK